MDMIFDPKNASIIYEQNGVCGKLLHTTQNTDYLYLIFKPSGKTESHVQDMLMTFFVAKGEALVIIDNEGIIVNQGQLLEIQAGMSRQWINTGADELHLLVVKVKQ